MLAAEETPLKRSHLFAAVALLATSALAPLAPTRAAAAPTLEPVERYGTWLGTRATADDLKGKVVIVDIFTFGCFNCKNVTPNLRALYRAHRGELEIVGIHTPETPFEANRANVVENLTRQGIVWPVAIDNDHVLWNAYGAEYWPTQMIFDRRGVLRKTVIGDSQDRLVDDTVKQLLAER
jgi:thiol-disulfide isomerase/thioredoxin